MGANARLSATRRKKAPPKRGKKFRTRMNAAMSVRLTHLQPIDYAPGIWAEMRQAKYTSGGALPYHIRSFAAAASFPLARWVKPQTES